MDSGTGNCFSHSGGIPFCLAEFVFSCLDPWVGQEGKRGISTLDSESRVPSKNEGSCSQSRAISLPWGFQRNRVNGEIPPFSSGLWCQVASSLLKLGSSSGKGCSRLSPFAHFLVNLALMHVRDACDSTGLNQTLRLPMAMPILPAPAAPALGFHSALPVPLSPDLA